MKYREARVVEHGSPQADFDRQVTYLSVAFRWISLAFIYLPLLVGAYLLAGLFLKRSDNGVVWLIAVLAIACGLHGMVTVIKSYMLFLRRSDKMAWVFIYVLLVAFTCLLTPYIAYGPISHAIARWKWPSAVTWILEIGIGVIIYKRYDFLNES